MKIKLLFITLVIALGFIFVNSVSVNAQTKIPNYTNQINPAVPIWEDIPHPLSEDFDEFFEDHKDWIIDPRDPNDPKVIKHYVPAGKNENSFKRLIKNSPNFLDKDGNRHTTQQLDTESWVIMVVSGGATKYVFIDKNIPFYTHQDQYILYAACFNPIWRVFPVNKPRANFETRATVDRSKVKISKAATNLQTGVSGTSIAASSGNLVQYVITVTVVGDVPARDVVVHDELPATGLVVVPNTLNGAYNQDLKNLELKEIIREVKIYYTCTVTSSPAPNTILENTAYATSSNADQTEKVSAKVSIIGQPNVQATAEVVACPDVDVPTYAPGFFKRVAQGAKTFAIALGVAGLSSYFGSADTVRLSALFKSIGFTSASYIVAQTVNPSHTEAEIVVNGKLIVGKKSEVHKRRLKPGDTIELEVKDDKSNTTIKGKATWDKPTNTIFVLFNDTCKTKVEPRETNNFTPNTYIDRGGPGKTPRNPRGPQPNQINQQNNNVVTTNNPANNTTVVNNPNNQQSWGFDPSKIRRKK